MSAIITSIHNCPVKSISFQNIDKCKINKNIGIEGDRVFAFSQNLDLDQSKEFEKEWATAINKKINLPGLNEKAEQVIFEKMIDKGTDIVAGVMTKILENK